MTDQPTMVPKLQAPSKPRGPGILPVTPIPDAMRGDACGVGMVLRSKTERGRLFRVIHHHIALDTRAKGPPCWTGWVEMVVTRLDDGSPCGYAIEDLPLPDCYTPADFEIGE